MFCTREKPLNLWSLTSTEVDEDRKLFFQMSMVISSSKEKTIFQEGNYFYEISHPLYFHKNAYPY